MQLGFTYWSDISEYHTHEAVGRGVQYSAIAGVESFFIKDVTLLMKKIGKVASCSNMYRGCLSEVLNTIHNETYLSR